MGRGSGPFQDHFREHVTSELEPLVVDFTVDAAIEHAFATWTERVSTWWPKTHIMNPDAVSEVVFEAREGGRIFERHADGTEHQWGWVEEWSPPNRVAYKWHLFFDASEATDVEVTFSSVDTGTAIQIRQTGWERLGAAAEARRTRTHWAWSELSALFVAALGRQTSG